METVMDVIFVTWMAICYAAMVVQLHCIRNVWGCWKIFCLKVIRRMMDPGISQIGHQL
jgi:hypothetical protein